MEVAKLKNLIDSRILEMTRDGMMDYNVDLMLSKSIMNLSEALVNLIKVEGHERTIGEDSGNEESRSGTLQDNEHF